MKKTFVKVLSVLLVGSAFLTPVESIAAGKTIGAYKCTKYSTAKGSNCVVEDDKLVAIVDGEGVKYTAVNWSEIQAKGVNK